MKRLAIVSALMLILTGVLGSTAGAGVTPWDYVDPALVGPDADHPWGGDQYRPGGDGTTGGRVAGTSVWTSQFGLFFRLFIDSYLLPGPIEPTPTTGSGIQIGGRQQITTIGQSTNLGSNGKGQSF
jgi:hypothetical protein